MKVLLINGSPHEKGCTHTALCEAAAVLEQAGLETEELWLGVEPVHGCVACGACAKTGRCFRDDGVNRFLDKMKEADGLILGSPVHFCSPTGIISTFLDRAFYAGGKVFEGKLGAAVVSCRRGGASDTFDQLNKYFTKSNMHVVSSQYWNSVHGSTPEDVLQDLEGLQTMRTLGKNMAWLLKCIEAGRAAGVPEPVREVPLRTDFIH